MDSMHLHLVFVVETFLTQKVSKMMAFMTAIPICISLNYLNISIKYFNFSSLI